MELKYKGRYLINEDEYKDKVLFFIAEDMNGDWIFNYDKGYFHLNMGTYVGITIPQSFRNKLIDYDQQEHDRRVKEKKEKLEGERQEIDDELKALDA